MFYLLHGTDVNSSRQALLDLKRKYSSDSISTFDAMKLDMDEFIRACETLPMLSERRLVILEGKPSTMQLSSRLTLPTTTDLVFWTDEELKSSNKLLKLVKEAGGQIRLFREKVPRHVFGFLDALGYKNKRKAFLELHRLLDQGEAPLYLLTMIVWQIRNLLNVKFQNSNVKKMNPYVLRKVQNQVKKFEGDELVEIFRNLLDAEVKLKTAQLNPALVLDCLVDRITQE